MKQCSKCNATKLIEEFRSGYICKICHNKNAREWRLKNPEKSKEASNKWKRQNKEKNNQIRRSWEIANREHRRQLNKIWQQNNKEYTAARVKRKRQENPADVNARNAKRRADLLKRTPKWLTSEDWQKINEFYKIATQLTRETGIPHEVDHIIPLKGKIVSGFHHPDNLQILTESENCSKNNKY